jgi:hypothetical protein
MTGPPGGAERGRSARTGPFPSAADQDRETTDKATGRQFESAAEQAVVERIREAARTAAPAPTTDELAGLLGCESLSTPVAVLRRLQLRGFFVFESYQRGRRFWLPDGRSTAPVSCSLPPWRWRGQEAVNG